jgi:HYR domain
MRVRYRGEAASRPTRSLIGCGALAMRLHARRVVLAAALATLAAAILAAAPTRSQATSSRLVLDAGLGFVADPAASCPPGSPASLACPVATAEGAVPGLGAVKETYTEMLYNGPPLCSDGYFKFLGYPARWVVATKGEIEFAIAESPCVGQGASGATAAFTVTGGHGIYEGASGSGTVLHAASPSSDGKFRGRERWIGTLSVPSLDFDTTPPTIRGARNKVVKVKKTARRARVSYSVTASDAVDGTVPATCAPRSGSFFRLGRTRVRCAAADTSANTATANFTVTVRRR